MIQHEEGSHSVQMHLESFTVAVGDQVSKGQQVGAVGNTGELTTGPHLHYATLPAGKQMPDLSRGQRLSPKDFVDPFRVHRGRLPAGIVLGPDVYRVGLTYRNR